MTDGLLIVDKPAGMTSHDVVDHVRRLLTTKKVGHAGTLDPDATGVLIVGVGRATRFLSYAQQGPKKYRAVATFGVTTSTQDASGDVLEVKPAPVERDEITKAAEEFLGEIQQIPPMVSAVKVGGHKLIDLARKGKEIERKSRPVTIHDLHVVGFVAGERPEATLDIHSSGGTYIRTLIHDLGQKLGCGAHMKSLRRTEAGGFSDAEAIPLADLTESHLRPMTDSVRQLFHFEVNSDAAKLIANGRPLNLFGGQLPGIDQGDFVAVVSNGVLLAVYRLEGERLLPDRVVATL